MPYGVDRTVTAKGRITTEELRQALAEDRDLLKVIVEETLQQVLEAEMDEALQAVKGERTANRQRRTLVVRIFPNAPSCLRLIRALAVEIHENWIEAMQYLNMEPLAEQKKEALRKLGDAA